MRTGSTALSRALSRRNAHMIKRSTTRPRGNSGRQALNDGGFMAFSTLMGIMGRMAHTPAKR